MKDITHFNATSVSDASSKLASETNAWPIAGGTDLVTHMRTMCYPGNPDTVINLKTIPNMDYITEDGGTLKIGALTKIATIANSSTVQGTWPALSQAAGRVASPQIRNVGTIGGNISQETRCWYWRTPYDNFACLKKNASGICYALVGDNRYHSIFGATNGCICVNVSDTITPLIAYGATIVTNKRQIPAAEYNDVVVAPNRSAMTVLDQDEIVTEIQVPTPPSGTKSAFLKFAFRNSIDFPICNCAAVIGGSTASIVFNGVHGTPTKSTAAEDAIAGKEINDANAAAAGNAAVQGAVTLVFNKWLVQITKTMVKRTVLLCA